jgi:hypothetical protein
MNRPKVKINVMNPDAASTNHQMAAPKARLRKPATDSGTLPNIPPDSKLNSGQNRPAQ